MATTNATMINSAGQKVVVQAGSQQARDLFGKGYQLMKGNKYTPPTTAIPADQLGQNNSYGQISRILGANVQPNQLNSDTAGLLALSGATTAGEKEVDTLNTQLTTAMGSLGGKAADLQAEQDKQGVGSAVTQVKELTLGAAKLQGEIAAFDAETDKISSNLGDQAIPTGLIQGQQAQLNQQRTLMHNSKVAELTATNSLIQAFQGNITLGQKMAEDAVNMKYAPIENQIQTLQTQLGIAKEHMSREDAKRADIISAMMEERKQKTAEAKELENYVTKVAIEAAANGASTATVNAIRKSKDPVTATQAAGRWIGSQAKGSSGVDISKSYKLTSTQTRELIGAGFSTDDIQNIQDNLKNGYTINDILNTPGLTPEMKKALGGTMSVPEVEPKFLDDKYFVTLYGGYGSKTLKEAAKKAGFGGFMGGLTGVSTAEQKRYIASITSKIDAYRRAGYTDKEIQSKMK